MNHPHRDAAAQLLGIAPAQLEQALTAIADASPTGADVPRLLTTKQVAAQLGVSSRTVTTMLARRDLLPVKVGRSTRVSAADVAAYIADHRAARQEVSR